MATIGLPVSAARALPFYWDRQNSMQPNPCRDELMSRTVAIVFNAESPLLVQKLAREIPIWIADTPQHSKLKTRSENSSDPLQFTWFPIRDSETLDQAMIRIVPSLDQHYDASSQTPGYDTLWVIGLPSKPSYLPALAQLGFTALEAMSLGFVVTK